MLHSLLQGGDPFLVLADFEARSGAKRVDESCIATGGPVSRGYPQHRARCCHSSDRFDPRLSATQLSGRANAGAYGVNASIMLRWLAVIQPPANINAHGCAVYRGCHQTAPC